MRRMNILEKGEEMSGMKRKGTGRGISTSTQILLRVILAAGLAFSACSSEDPEDFRSNWDGHLDPCQSCGELEHFLKDSATRMVKMAYQQPDACHRMVWLPGLPGLEFGIGPVDAPGEDTSEKDEYSSTNIQEAGVDEPDVVKTDIATKADVELEWHQVKHLPGYLRSSIRAFGRQIFRAFTKTPIEEIQVLASLGGREPNSMREIDAAAGWLQKNGVKDTHAVMDFERSIPDYKAELVVYRAG